MSDKDMLGFEILTAVVMSDKDMLGFEVLTAVVMSDKDMLGFEVLTAVATKSSIFWDITWYSPLKVD
jgi:hypothetical protein